MLPHIAPMLATATAPFDYPDYAFEIKWDRGRALAAVAAYSANASRASLVLPFATRRFGRRTDFRTGNDSSVTKDSSLALL